MVANTVICLIHQANYLLDQQISALERAFVQGGGYGENLLAARLAERAGKDRTDPSDRSAPICPTCGKGMVFRTARKGAFAGSRFWGCVGYPECKGTRPTDMPG